MNVEIPYSPRPLQTELHDALDAHRFAVVVTHRRFGKTVLAINHLLRAAVMCELPNPRFAYLSPTYRQSKAVAFDYLKSFAGAIPGAKFHETELRCDLPNGARISLLGAENPESLEGPRSGPFSYLLVILDQGFRFARLWASRWDWPFISRMWTW